MYQLLIVCTLFASICLTACGPLLGAKPIDAGAEFPTKPIGREAAVAGAIHRNGFNVIDIADARLKTAYTKLERLLGDPIGGFTGGEQMFEYGKLTFDPAAPEPYIVSLANQGTVWLQARFRAPISNATAHPAVQAWTLEMMGSDGLVQGGLDPLRHLGKPISPPLCEGGICYQPYEKAVFCFPDGATSAAEVQRLPVGLLTMPATSMPQAPKSDPPILPILVGVGVLIALVLLLARRKPQQYTSF